MACPSVQGYTLLGETAKYMPVSPNRFRKVDISAAGISTELVGKAGEVVELTFARPDGTLGAAKATIAASGIASLQLK